MLSCVPYQLQDRFCVFWCLPCLFQESIFSGLKILKASSLGSVGKFTEKKMEHPYGKQYGQEGNPRAYMTMRDYRNLPYQWGNQPPVGRNPNPNMSMREYRDQWMSGPVYSVPSTYPPPLQFDHPEPRPREDEGQRHSSYQGESIHTISEKTLMIEQLNILTRRMDEMEMKNQHNIHSVNEFSASQPSCYNPQSPQSPQPLQSIHPLEQAMLDLNWIMDDYVEANKKIRAHSIVTVEDNLNKKIDGLKDDFEHKWDNLHDFSEDLIDQQECPPEEECQSGTRIEEQRVVTVQANQETETIESSMDKELDGFQSESDQKLDIQQEPILKPTNQFVHPEEENLEEESQEEESLTETVLVEQAQLQPQEELEVESLEAPEALQEASVNFWPWTKEKEITALLTEKSSGHEGTQEPFIQPNPIDLDHNATAQDTKTPLPAAPPESVYILPTPATKSKPAAPAPKGESNTSLHAMQNIIRLVASVHTFATTSNKMANAYIAWHSGWFGCGFGFGAPGPRHF